MIFMMNPIEYVEFIDLEMFCGGFCGVPPVPASDPGKCPCGGEYKETSRSTVTAGKISRQYISYTCEKCGKGAVAPVL